MLTDEKWLSFILEQILSNAVKYTVKGSVTIEVNEKKQLTVSDTGIGIAMDDQERVFERFYRVDKSHSKAIGGTGLGLSIVKHVVMFHHGNIHIQSVLGEGTTITVLFPIHYYTAE